MTARKHGDIPTWQHDVQHGQTKEEKHPAATDCAADFVEQKSHSSLGRFLHAPLR